MNSKDWEYRYSQLSDRLPVDPYPASNGEFLPCEASEQQHRIMALYEEEAERTRRRRGLSRRRFVRSAAAFTLGFWSISQIVGGRWGRYAVAQETPGVHTPNACDLEWPGAQLNNLPGEFIFDLQSHHVDPDGEWRAINQSSHLVFMVAWPQAGPLGGTPSYEDGEVHGWGYGEELDPIRNLSRFHYLKQLYLDSSTNMTVLSATPAGQEQQPLPTDEAALTVGTVNYLAQNTPRCVMHPFVYPNRGSAAQLYEYSDAAMPALMEHEFEMMERNLRTYGWQQIRGWKVYTPFSEVRYISGWWHDDPVGMAFAEKVRELGDNYDAPKLVCTHKGFALPGFDQEKASCRDIGPAASAFPDIDFVVYHSGYDGEEVGPYPGDDQVPVEPNVNTLIKSLRENGLDAESHVPAGLEHGNAPNVYAELGAVWRSIMDDPDQAVHLLGKLIKYVGPRRVVWGTDSLWFGSPQSQIVALRALEFTEEAKEFYNLPYGLDGDRFDPRRNAFDPNSYTPAHRGHPNVDGWPTDRRAHPERSIRNGIFGRNAADAYRIDPEATRKFIDCDDVQKLRDGYLLNPSSPPQASAPLASNEMVAPRTRRDVLNDLLRNPPWFD